MSLKRRSGKPVKMKKSIAMLECLTQSVSSNKESVQKIHDQIELMMRQKNPAFVAEPLQKVDEETPDSCRMDPVQKFDQEVKETVKALSSDLGTNTSSTPHQNEAASEPVMNGYSLPCVSNGSSNFSPKKPSNNSTKIDSSKRRSPFDPNFIIKVEDSGSDDSNLSEEMKKTEHVVSKMMAPCSAPMNPMAPKSLLHYVVIENLPIRSTADELVNELFIGLLGISREDVTGITVHNEKTECIAQIYFKDLKHVQKLLVFSGKLVFNGRVITSKIGAS